MRRDELHLVDVVESADRILGWLDGMSVEERYDAAQRSVARAAAAYFLEVADAVEDHRAGGLMDDVAVVHAAREVLAAG